MDLERILQALNPDIIDKFKEAIALGKWPDGSLLTLQQKETCMQAVIAFEQTFVAEDERTAYVPAKSTACETPAQKDKTSQHGDQTLTWK